MAGAAVGRLDLPRRAWPIVVGGCHRSGTSLIRRILDTHSRIHCGPEVTFFRDFYGDYFDDRLSHLRFATTARHLVAEIDLLEVLGRAFVELHERAAARAGKPRWADKAPENVLYLAEWERLLGQRWLFVHVVRNPLDTLASMKEVGFPLTLPADLPGRVTLYRRYIEAAWRFATEYPTRCYPLVYEGLAQDPAGSIAELMAWLGEAFEPGQLRFNDVPHAVGLEDPKIATTRAVHRESVNRWRSVLTDDEAEYVRSHTLDLWRAATAGARAPAASG
jgi:hypothetical protein